MAVVHVFLNLAEGERLPKLEAVLIANDETEDGIGGSTIEIHWDTGDGYATIAAEQPTPVEDP